ncbi:MAG: hypothetical protein IK095_05695, partial [Oscillospiraceae bacterium]|nr:hypothetical protein [Oscillospiraceae bacterium]
MKRAMCILMALLFLLGLSACGKQKAEPSQETPRLDSVDPETGAWLGQGGCYQMESLEMPEGAGDNILFYHDGQFYTQRIKDLRDTRIYRGGEEILRYEGIPLYVCKTEDGLWVEDEERDEERKAVILTRFSFTGEQLQQLRLELPPYIYPLGMKAEEGRIYLNCSASLRVYDDEEGSLLCDIPHEEWSGHPIRGGDGKVYFLDQGDRGGGSLSAIDTEAGSFDLRFVYEKGSLSTGDAESPFFLCCSDGIYRMELDGQIRPLVIWDECGLSTSGVSEVQTLGDGRFRLSGITGDRTLLVPAEPSELRARTTLTICVVPSQTALDTGIDDVSMYYTKIIRSITAFNACSRDCCVKFVDLSENGALTAEQAITKLNTRILSGEAPDMIVFQGGISPFSYIRQGLLRDFREDLAADPEIAEEDLILARAIENDCGGLYLMTDGLSME